MGNHAQALNMRLEPCGWSSAVEYWLAQTLGGSDIRVGLDNYREQVQAGAALFALTCGDHVIGATILRIDQMPNGPEGVIVAAAMQMAGVDMASTVLPHIEAKFQGVKSIRYHTENAALVRKLRRYGYTQREIVCAKTIH
jgi:fructose-1,6-bisphosphatase/sedoheptulose 1,7-bisphosphatase-like protein